MEAPRRERDEAIMKRSLQMHLHRGMKLAHLKLAPSWHRAVPSPAQTALSERARRIGGTQERLGGSPGHAFVRRQNPAKSSRIARSGRRFSVTALATRIPSLPSARAFLTSWRSWIPAPQRTRVEEERRRARPTVLEITSGRAADTERRPPMSSGGSMARNGGRNGRSRRAARRLPVQRTAVRPTASSRPRVARMDGVDRGCSEWLTRLPSAPAARSDSTTIRR